MCVVGDLAGDFGQMPGHGVGVAPWHDERCHLAEFRAGLPHTRRTSAPRSVNFVVQWLAYTLPCQRFTDGLTTDRA